MKRLAIALALVLAACGDTGETESKIIFDGEAEPKIIFDGEACNYEGPTSFPLGTVDFIVLNDSDYIGAGFSVWRVPEGTTLDDIAERGMLEVGIPDDDPGGVENGSVTLRPPHTNRPGEEYSMQATFEIEGTYAADCWIGPTADFPAIVFEVE